MRIKATAHMVTTKTAMTANRLFFIMRAITLRLQPAERKINLQLYFRVRQRFLGPWHRNCFGLFSLIDIHRRRRCISEEERCSPYEGLDVLRRELQEVLEITFLHYRILLLNGRFGKTFLFFFHSAPLLLAILLLQFPVIFQVVRELRRV